MELLDIRVCGNSNQVRNNLIFLKLKARVSLLRPPYHRRAREIIMNMLNIFEDLNPSFGLLYILYGRDAADNFIKIVIFRTNSENMVPNF